jgi:DNA processing protein
VSAPPLVLLAAALLRIPARRLRALALGDDGALRDWIANESALRLAEARRDARVALRRLETLRARVVSLAAADYPAGLRELRDPPPFLTVRGTLPASSLGCEGTAIVGARDADGVALRAARALAACRAAPIVSGLARGIDAAAHEGALGIGAPTIAYVGSGLGSTYPPEHAELAERIVAGGGALVSELLPDEPVTRWALVRRDRLQAAHAASLVLVASENDGGAMHAFRAATSLGRPRYTMEPLPGARYDGNRTAVAAGAAVLDWKLTNVSPMEGPLR